MSKIRELKSNTNNILNFIDVLELFSPDKKSKYTETLLRLMNRTKNYNDQVDDMKRDILSKFDFIKIEDLDKFGPLQTMLMYNFVNSFFNEEDLKKFRQFAEYNERGLITQNDLTKYKSLEDVIQQLNIAELKVESKGLENEIVKVFEDDEWLLVRPLTYLASKKYGSNTKWCTTQSVNPEHFLKYTKKGVLIYCINKVTGYKVASFYSLEKNDPEFSFWNQKDAKIDSLDSELTDELRKIIQTVSKGVDAKTNRFLLSDDQRIKEENFIKKGMNNINLYENYDSQPHLETHRTRLNRIGEAIRRENMEQQIEEERNDEHNYENRENLDVPESPIDRMRWISTINTNGAFTVPDGTSTTNTVNWSPNSTCTATTFQGNTYNTSGLITTTNEPNQHLNIRRED